MKVRQTCLPGVLLVEPAIFGDERGFLLESYHTQRYAQAGIDGPFPQDNVSFSRQGILRGLHLQHPYPQGKLVHVLEGEVFDVAVDVRRGSPTFGNWVGESISSTNRLQLWVPSGFAHGFCVTSETALVTYKCTEIYHPECEITIRWDDPQIAITWPMRNVLLSEKDSNAPLLEQIPETLLPTWITRDR